MWHANDAIDCDGGHCDSVMILIRLLSMLWWTVLHRLPNFRYCSGGGHYAICLLATVNVVAIVTSGGSV